MKCPKCGSEAVFEKCKPTYDCKCGECNNSWQSEPTTAEMWEWLGKNFSVALEHRNGQKDRLEIAHGFWNFIAEENGFENCVRTAYEGAKKKEEQNAKN